MKRRTPNATAALAAQAVRLAMLLALVCGLRVLSAAHAIRRPPPPVELADVQAVLPAAASISPLAGDAQLWQVTDKDHAPLAIVATTSPQADHIAGYAGPNNVLILMDDQQRVVQARLLRSSDTRDHVDRVRESPRFWQQFVGWQVGQSSSEQLDGVSGATLTSLAIAEAIAERLSGERRSLRFPDEVTLQEAQALWPAAGALQPNRQLRARTDVVDAAGQKIGSILRSGPLVDSVVGYQGPTELLVALDDHDVITKIRLRYSFDNDQYVRYTRQEASFWAKFVGRSLADLSHIDLEAEGIEGVSGATMTSMAVAETLRLAARRHLEEQSALMQPAGRLARRWNWSLGEVSTALIALLVIPWSLSRWRGNRRLRWLWQALCLVAIVGVSGNLISMALLSGWTRTGLPFRLAPGLASLVVVALAAPAILGRNVYCDHVCPHGIAQQWLARGTRKRSSKGERASSRRGRWWRGGRWLLTGSAVMVIGLAIAWILWQRPEQISWLEPFDTYAWRIGLSASLLVWLASLLLAVKEPMGYCRLACPTGKVLEYTRLKRAGWRVGASDMLVFLLTAAVWSAVMFI